SDSSVPANVAFDSVTIDSFTGGLTLHVKDSFGGGPVAGANISSTLQPSGVHRVSHVTNSSGTAAFPCLAPGVYKFEISRAGYIGQSTTVTVSGKNVDETINVSSTVPWLLIEYAGIAAGIAIVVLAALIVLRRRKRSSVADFSQKK
ncbi:carboxypeptidase regulatory-like domain-containing protein, partial [Candidatus Bathyarchaeota archaeon]|nr:carboxypeptidase regulatory-like domain-containing protein [Candidatus Bathyarchaeota archaeon]